MPARAGADLALSKSLFLKGWQCSKALWLTKRRKDLIPPVDEARQFLFDQGKVVGQWAHRRFSEGVLIDAPHDDPAAALAATEKAMRAGAQVLFEATFRHDSVLVRTDVLRRAPKGAWDLLEVKMSTQPKPEHVPDLAVQARVLAGAGLRLRRTALLLVDRDYVRRGPVDPVLLFREVDLTGDVRGALPEVESLLRDLRRDLEGPEAPAVEIGRHCEDPYPCDFIAHCWKDVPEYSVYDIPRIRFEKADELRRKGILEPAGVPKTVKLSAFQRLQVDVARAGAPRADLPALRRRLAALKPPLHFLDFETTNPAVPPYEGLRPYQQLPFQFSLRLQDAKGGTHAEWLADGGSDPRPELARRLADALRPSGSVVAYHAAFEGRVLADLAAEVPEHAPALLGARDRLWDLEQPFASGEYAHARFFGSSSIKAVLPALVPSLGYAGLAIAEGSAASRAYLELMSGRLDADRAERLREDLRVYCGRDTEAMAAVLAFLKEAAGGA